MPSTLPTNPIWLGIVLAIAFVVSIAPVVKSWIEDRKHGSTPSVVVTTAPTPQPQLDAGNALLTKLVEDLKERAEDAERESAAYAKENGNLQARLARAEERIERLTNQVQMLTERLMQRGERD